MTKSNWELAPKSGGGVFKAFAVRDDHLALFNVADPTNDTHGMSRGYADKRHAKKGDIISPDNYLPLTGGMVTVTSGSGNHKERDE